MEKDVVVRGIFTNDIPIYQTEHSAGADICSANEENVTVMPGERILIPTGMYLEIPDGFEGQVRPRSGLAVKHGVTVLNAPGTIDADYRGEVRVALINHGDKPFEIRKGDRIAQLIIAPVTQVQFKPVETVNDTERGSGGFGSTGK